MSVPITPTICNPSFTPDPGGGAPCPATGAGVSTDTPEALANGVLTNVDFDTIDFETPPSSADLANDGVVAGALGAYAVGFTLNFGATADPGATATTFVFVNGVQALPGFVHALGAAPSTQHVATSLVLGPGNLVQLFVQQDGALEGVLLNSATLSILLPCTP